MKDGLNFTRQIEGGEVSGSRSDLAKKRKVDDPRLGLLRSREWQCGGLVFGEILKAKTTSMCGKVQTTR